MVLKMTHLSGCAEIKRTLITVATQHFTGYKYLLHLKADNHLTVLFSFLLAFRVVVSCSLLANNGGQESHQTRSLSLQRGESIPAKGFITPPTFTGVGARGSSGKAPVVNLSSSSDEGDLTIDVSRDEAFARRPFGDLNRDVLGPPNNSKTIILSDSDEEEEVREEKAANAEAVPSSAARSLASTTSADAYDAPMEVENDNSDGRTPDQEANGSNVSGDDAGLP
jgi:hypothetical protein